MGCIRKPLVGADLGQSEKNFQSMFDAVHTAPAAAAIVETRRRIIQSQDNHTEYGASHTVVPISPQEIS